VGARFCTPPDWPWSSPSLLCYEYGVIHGVKVVGAWCLPSTPPPHIVPKLKKEYSYTSAPPLGLYSMSVGEVYVLPSVQRHAGE